MADTPPPDPGLGADLSDAVRRAVRYVGFAPEGPDSRPRLRFVARSGGGRRLVVLTGTLLVVAGLGTYLSVRSFGEPEVIQQEEDLRWAVAHVVRRVETLRARTGRLPSPEELHGLVNDLVVYETLGDGYWVVAERGRSRVQYDGSVPLEEWVSQATDSAEPGAR